VTGNLRHISLKAKSPSKGFERLKGIARTESLSKGRRFFYIRCDENSIWSRKELLDASRARRSVCGVCSSGAGGLRKMTQARAKSNGYRLC
jgi:hypothetical protein